MCNHHFKLLDFLFSPLQQILKRDIILSELFILFTEELKLFFIRDPTLAQLLIQHGVRLVCRSLLRVSQLHGLDLLERFQFCFECIDFILLRPLVLLVDLTSQVVKLLLFIDVFVKDCIELHSRSNKLLIDFFVILSMGVDGGLLEQILLLGEVLAGCSGMSKDWQDDAAVAFWSRRHPTCPPLHLAHILHRILRFRTLKPTLPGHALGFSPKGLLLWFFLKLR